MLEVGGGTGGTTAAVLSVLPGERTEYLFTDVSPTFTSRAAKRFHAWPFLRTRPLDLERDPIEQRLGAGTFDIVIAANVVHATRDIRRTLERCRRVLAPGGLLVLVEVTAPQRWIDITFGLTDGWWHFTDRDLRPRYPLLSPSRWRDLLQEMGFSEVATIPEAPAATGTFAANTVIVARGPSVASDDAPAWIVLADQTGVGDRLAALLDARGERVVVAHAGRDCGPTANRSWTVRPGVREDLDRLLAEGVAAGSGWRGIVHCWAMDAAPGERGTDLGSTQRETCGSLLHVTQALSVARATVAPRLWVATRGAQPVGAVTVAVEQSTVLGLGRTIALEHPELRCTLVDLDPADEDMGPEYLCDEILADADEDEIVYRAGIRHIARLVTCAATGPRSRSPRPAAEVFAGRQGVLDSLTLRPLQRRVPGPGEVEIEVRAVGLNFKDVLNVLGLYPGDPGPLGSECAGILTAVGPGVEGLQPGQAVVAVAPGSFATHVTAGAGLVARKPRTWTFDEAASIPIAFVTAWYALRSVAELRSGERVLIHAAAGGVGLAAVQVARELGAKVFATAGTPEKRAYLRVHRRRARLRLAVALVRARAARAHRRPRRRRRPQLAVRRHDPREPARPGAERPVRRDRQARHLDRGGCRTSAPAAPPITSSTGATSPGRSRSEFARSSPRCWTRCQRTALRACSRGAPSRSVRCRPRSGTWRTPATSARWWSPSTARGTTCRLRRSARRLLPHHRRRRWTRARGRPLAGATRREGAAPDEPSGSQHRGGGRDRDAQR